MPDNLARTVEDVKRLAPTAGFYWVRFDDLLPRPTTLDGVLAVMRLGWWMMELREAPRYWRVMGGSMFPDAALFGTRIIGPLTPPSEENGNG